MSFDKNDFFAAARKSIITSANIDEEREYLIRRAPNALEWLTGKQWANQPSFFNHWGAYKMVKDFFELRCPNDGCNDEDKVPSDPWGQSIETIQSEVLLTWSNTYEEDTCPKCGTTRSQFVDDGYFNNYNVLHGIIGQRSFKSGTLGLIGTYVEHVTLCIAHGYEGGLHDYLGMPRGEPLQISFVASTDTQAKDTIWAKYRNYRTSAPWFRRYIPWLKAQEKLQETPKGLQRWEYNENDGEVDNGFMNLKTNSKNSNSHGLAGATRIAAFVDEVCRMKQTDAVGSAREIYTTMLASCKTVKSAVGQLGLIPWFGMLGSVSSPYSSDDYGMDLLEQAKHDKSMFTVHKATWDFTPWLPKSEFEDDLKKDYNTTMRNFGAQPSVGANPYVDRPDDFLEMAVDKTLKPTATFTSYDFVDPKGCSMLGVRLNKADLILRGEPRFLAFDAGSNFDAFAVACAHGERDEMGNLVTVFDWCIRLVTKSRKQEVYFESVYQLLKELQQFVTIKQVMMDHWNSRPLVTRIRSELNVWCEEEHTYPEHWIQFLRDGYSGYIKMLPALPDDESKTPLYKSAQAAMLYEILKLERDDKDRVYNPNKGKVRGVASDDMARVAVHVHRLVQDQGFTEKQDDNSRRARKKRVEVAGAQWVAQQRGQVFNPTQGTSGIGGYNVPRPDFVRTRKF